jgi:CubicO group peptidase (beta-lactamase class C family)
MVKPESGTLEPDSALANFLAHEVSDGVLGVGGQASLIMEGRELVNIAIGTCGGGRPMTIQTIHNVWCASKPIVAVGLLALSEDRGMSFDEHLCDQAPDDPYLGSLELSPWDLLNHSAGLALPSMAEALFLRPHVRLRAVVERRWERGAAYSEYGAGRLLEHLFAVSYGQDVGGLLTERMLKHLPLASPIWFPLSFAHVCKLAPLIGGLFPNLPIRETVANQDLSPVLAGVDRVAGGAYLSMHGLAQFYASLGRVLAGDPLVGLPSPAVLLDALGHSRGMFHDRVLDRVCDFASGFMIELSCHGYGELLSHRAIGHTGITGNMFGLIDPERQMALAILLNGCFSSYQDVEYFVRRGVAAAVADADACS